MLVCGAVPCALRVWCSPASGDASSAAGDIRVSVGTSRATSVGGALHLTAGDTTPHTPHATAHTSGFAGGDVLLAGGSALPHQNHGNNSSDSNNTTASDNEGGGTGGDVWVASGAGSLSGGTVHVVSAGVCRVMARGSETNTSSALQHCVAKGSHRRQQSGAVVVASGDMMPFNADTDNSTPTAVDVDGDGSHGSSTAGGGSSGSVDVASGVAGAAGSGDVRVASGISVGGTSGGVSIQAGHTVPGVASDTHPRLAGHVIVAAGAFVAAPEREEGVVGQDGSVTPTTSGGGGGGGGGGHLVLSAGHVTHQTPHADAARDTSLHLLESMLRPDAHNTRAPPPTPSTGGSVGGSTLVSGGNSHTGRGGAVLMVSGVGAAASGAVVVRTASLPEAGAGEFVAHPRRSTGDMVFQTGGVEAVTRKGGSDRGAKHPRRDGSSNGAAARVDTGRVVIRTGDTATGVAGDVVFQAGTGRAQLTPTHRPAKPCASDDCESSASGSGVDATVAGAASAASRAESAAAGGAVVMAAGDTLVDTASLETVNAALMGAAAGVHDTSGGAVKLAGGGLNTTLSTKAMLHHSSRHAGGVVTVGAATIRHPSIADATVARDVGVDAADAADVDDAASALHNSDTVSVPHVSGGAVRIITGSPSPSHETLVELVEASLVAPHMYRNTGRGGNASTPAPAVVAASGPLILRTFVWWLLAGRCVYQSSPC